MEKIQDLVHIFNLLIPHNPFVEWGRINFDLDKKYKEYGIIDNLFGRNVKNSSRHFTGGALGNKFYGENITNWLGEQKEKFDARRDNGKSWLNEDTNVDYLNNLRGINFSKQNPHIKRNNVYDEAIFQSIRNYNKDYPKK